MRLLRGATLHAASMRYASLEVIEDHVKYLIDTYAMNVLTIYDDKLLLNHKRAKDFFRILAKYNLRVERRMGLTVAYIDEEMAALMKAAGMDTVQLAIESGTEHMLRNVIKKPLGSTKSRPSSSPCTRTPVRAGLLRDGNPGRTRTRPHRDPRNSSRMSVWIGRVSASRRPFAAPSSTIFASRTNKPCEHEDRRIRARDLHHSRAGGSIPTRCRRCRTG